MVILGVDYGDKRIGLALCDLTETLSYPHKTLNVARMRDAVEAVKSEAIKSEAALIVVGLPMNMDGSEGLRADKTRAFARVLQKATGLTVELSDERLSSLEADERLAHTKRRVDGARDMAAAQIILESYLNGRKTVVK